VGRGKAASVFASPGPHPARTLRVGCTRRPIPVCTAYTRIGAAHDIRIATTRKVLISWASWSAWIPGDYRDENTRSFGMVGFPCRAWRWHRDPVRRGCFSARGRYTVGTGAFRRQDHRHGGTSFGRGRMVPGALTCRQPAPTGVSSDRVISKAGAAATDPKSGGASIRKARVQHEDSAADVWISNLRRNISATESILSRVPRDCLRQSVRQGSRASTAALRGRRRGTGIRRSLAVTIRPIAHSGISSGNTTSTWSGVEKTGFNMGSFSDGAGGVRGLTAGAVARGHAQGSCVETVGVHRLELMGYGGLDTDTDIAHETGPLYTIDKDHPGFDRIHIARDPLARLLVVMRTPVRACCRRRAAANFCKLGALNAGASGVAGATSVSHGVMPCDTCPADPPIPVGAEALSTASNT
jgi:hypothetical protein